MNVAGTALKTALLSAAMVVMAATATTGTALATAAAPPASCPTMRNPVNATNTVTRKQKTMPNSQTLELRSGTISGLEYAWARILNSKDGDVVWVDYSIDGGANWRQCDLRTLSGGVNYGYGLLTSSSSSVCMRAGARPKAGAVSYLTAWWC
ncbi:hypothetical protein [Nonomuraea sp. NPDC001699]